MKENSAPEYIFQRTSTLYPPLISCYLLILDEFGYLTSSRKDDLLRRFAFCKQSYDLTMASCNRIFRFAISILDLFEAQMRFDRQSFLHDISLHQEMVSLDAYREEDLLPLDCKLGKHHILCTNVSSIVEILGIFL